LKIKGLMKTAAGRAAAEKRTAIIDAFLAAFHDEWAGTL